LLDAGIEASACARNSTTSMYTWSTPMGNVQYCPNTNVRSDHLKNYKLNWNGANLTSYANTAS